MKPDSMLVEPRHIGQALQAVTAAGPMQALEQLQRQEPALAAFVQEKLAAMAGVLTVSGAPQELAAGVHQQALLVLLGSVEALRRGYYDLWHDTAMGPRLAQLLPPAPRRPRRQRGKDGTEPSS